MSSSPSMRSTGCSTSTGPCRESLGRYAVQVARSWCSCAPASECGLTVSASVVDDLSWDFGSTDAFARWCTVGFGAWTERLPSDSIVPFVADVIHAYEASTGSSQILHFLQLRARL